MGVYRALRPQRIGDDVRPEGATLPEVFDWDPNVREKYVLAGEIQYVPDADEDYWGPTPNEPHPGHKPGNEFPEDVQPPVIEPGPLSVDTPTSATVDERNQPADLTIEQQIAADWDALLEPPDLSHVQVTEQADVDTTYPATGNIKAVKAWIGNDKDRANFAYEQEAEREKPRPTLVTWLEAFDAPAEPEGDETKE